jgi:CheY-like chemotaxis protein
MNDAQRRKILLVDDDRLVLATLQSGLEQAGYAVQACSSAEEAKRVLALDNPDIAVLDIRMPGASGLDLARELGESQAIPFLFLTAYSEAEVVRKAAEYGAVGYLVKPVDRRSQATARTQRAEEILELLHWVRILDGRPQLQMALNENREVSMASLRPSSGCSWSGAASAARRPSMLVPARLAKTVLAAIDDGPRPAPQDWRSGRGNAGCADGVASAAHRPPSCSTPAKHPDRRFTPPCRRD